MSQFKTMEDGESITFAEKEVHIFEEDTVHAAYAFSNNDASEKHIWCLLKDKKNIVVDGNGALLMFHDRITPFLLDNCENVCLRNFTIDYSRPFFTQGTILYADERCLELQIHDEYAYRVEGKNLIMESETWENDLHDGIMLFQEFDPKTRSLAYDAPVMIYRVGEDAQVDPTSPLPMKILTAEQTDRGTLRLHGEFACGYTVGNELVMTHEKRCNPGIGLNGCKNIRLEEIHIVHTGSMGIVAQLSSDLFLYKVKVALGDHPQRLVSTNCDATHFVACAGRIDIVDCTLENMMDDGVNVHGVYTRVAEICGVDTIETELMHFQHFGVNFYRTGDEVAAYRGHTATLRERKILKSVQMIRQDRIRLKFTQPVALQVGDFIENLTASPELYIKGLQTGHNRPRGILPTTSRKVVIEDSLFYNSGYGVHIAGDTQFWYESGAVQDVVIRNNRFIHCGHSMGNFSIAITPEYEQTEENPLFHRNIKIQNNIFESFVDGMVYAYGVSALTVQNNMLLSVSTYRKRLSTAPVVVRNCQDVCADETVQYVQEALW